MNTLSLVFGTFLIGAVNDDGIVELLSHAGANLHWLVGKLFHADNTNQHLHSIDLISMRISS